MYTVFGKKESGVFLSRVSTSLLTRDVDIGILFVCLSACPLVTLSSGLTVREPYANTKWGPF